MKIAIVLVLAILLDRLMGELTRLHPLVGFGNLATSIESRLNNQGDPNKSRIIARLKGLFAVILLIAPFVVLVQLFSQATGAMHAVPLQSAVGVIVLYLALGAKSLSDHARAVGHAVNEGDLAQARAKVSLIVSRETAQMDMVAVQRAAIESVLENGSDAIFGAIFWFVVLGAPGVVLYRLSNTLDAMWGYKNERYLNFGWAAARLDDVLCFIPARLTALSYTLLGNPRMAWQCWSRQGKTWYSPNAGPVMAAGAGALELELGGPAIYHGAPKVRPILGEGRPPMPGDIDRAVNLVNRCIWLWVAVVVLGALIIHA
jgi:adenosylcobinamide-phosphate synthase